MIINEIAALRNSPYVNVDPFITNTRESASSGFPIIPINGVTKELTKESMSSVKAAPRTTATQRSTTLPRMMKSLRPAELLPIEIERKTGVREPCS